MDTKQLAKYRKWLDARAPLIGRWLRRRAVRALVKDGSLEAAALLAEAVGNGWIDGRGSADAVQRWQGPSRALFYFLTEQWEQYESLDFDHQLLRAVYQAAADGLRQRLMAQARAAGRLEWVEVVAGGRQARRLADMNTAEWETALTVLAAQRQWEAMWRLAQRAPPCWSARLLGRLSEASWQPPPAERPGFADLLALARHWHDPDFGAGPRPFQTLQGHTFWISCLAVSPDGRLLASGSNDNTVRLWGLPEGRLLHTLRGHQNSVRCLAVSPDGRLLASGGSVDNAVRLWGSDLVRVAQLPAEQAMPGDLEWAQATLQDRQLVGSNRQALEFIAALLRWKARFDVVVDDAPQRIAAGDFDIEIEG